VRKREKEGRMSEIEEGQGRKREVKEGQGCQGRTRKEEVSRRTKWHSQVRKFKYIY
jgi:hypothetical protein